MTSNLADVPLNDIVFKVEEQCVLHKTSGRIRRLYVEDLTQSGPLADSRSLVTILNSNLCVTGKYHFFYKDKNFNIVARIFITQELRRVAQSLLWAQLFWGHAGEHLLSNVLSAFFPRGMQATKGPEAIASPWTSTSWGLRLPIQWTPSFQPLVTYLKEINISP